MDRQLRVVEDCAGISAFSLALRRLGIPHEHVLLSERDRACRAFLRANYAVECPIEEDLRARDFAVTRELQGKVDLYIAGFPCKDASRHNPHRMGLAGKHTSLFHLCRRTIETLLPKVAILENVVGLKDRRAGQQASDWEIVRSELEALAATCGYTFRHATLNVRDLGLPQNRDRVFMVLIRDDCAARPFVWPARFPSPLAEALLDGQPLSRSELQNKRPSADFARRNYELFMQSMLPRGGNHAFDELYMLSLVSRASRQGKAPTGVAPCLTASRSYLWLTTYGRYASIQECCRLQGFQLHDMRGLAERAGDGRMSEPQLSTAIGNSIGANVAELLLREVLPSAGLSGELPDRWRDGTRLQQLQAGMPLDAAAAVQFFPTSWQFE